jgi:membrane-associated phospholipid phosphatase
MLCIIFSRHMQLSNEWQFRLAIERQHFNPLPAHLLLFMKNKPPSDICFLFLATNDKLKKVLLSLLFAGFSSGCFAWGSATAWGNLSDALAVGLPLLAVGDTLATKDNQGLWELSFSLGATVASTQILKSTISENRPDNSGNDGFPSGHTAVAFSAARYLTKRNDLDLTYSAALYGLAALTGAARVEADKHTWGQVLAGGALGFAMSEIFTKQKNYQISVLPMPRGVQLAFRAQW